MAVMEVFATRENQISSHIGTCFDADKPVAFDTRPTSAVSPKWNPVSVVAEKWQIPLKDQFELDRLLLDLIRSKQKSNLKTKKKKEKQSKQRKEYSRKRSGKENKVQTKAKTVTGRRHKLLVSHNDADGADNVHGPRSDIGHCRRLLLARRIHFQQQL